MSDIVDYRKIIDENKFDNDHLFNFIYSGTIELDLQPKKEHIVSSIAWLDIKPRVSDFLGELINTIVDWVYNSKKQNELINERFAKTSSYGNASTFLYQLARSKFRDGHFQGQFGELLLCNFLQKFFDSAPLVRKMKISTSSDLERFGADAIHFGCQNDNPILYLGEAKCYTSGAFSAAVKNSVNSIFTTFENIDNELNLYTYDDFLTEDMEIIAKKYKDNELENMRFELVCIIIYNESKQIQSDNENSIREEIQRIVVDRCSKLSKDFYSNYDKRTLNRIHYIIFPIWELQKVLEEYEKKM